MPFWIFSETEIASDEQTRAVLVQFWSKFAWKPLVTAAARVDRYVSMHFLRTKITKKIWYSFLVTYRTIMQGAHGWRISRYVMCMTYLTQASSCSSVTSINSEYDLHARRLQYLWSRRLLSHAGTSVKIELLNVKDSWPKLNHPNYLEKSMKFSKV